jgi:O-succinylbenzoic acid--CoA ligase
MNKITPALLEKFWRRKAAGDSLWMVPTGLSSAQMKLLAQAQSRLSMYQDLIWFSSSGSTSDGGLKFFAHTRKTLEAASRGSNRHLKTSSKDHVLNLLPLFHVGGFSTWLRARLGGYAWSDHSHKKWDPVRAANFMFQENVTLTSFVPAQVHDLVALKIQAPPALRAIVVGGGRLNEELYVKALSLGWPVLPSYGLTELGSQVATASLESFDKEIFPHLHWLPHVSGFTQDQRGRWWIQSPSSCLYQMQITAEGVFSLEQKNRGKHGLLLDDDLKVNEDLKSVEVLGRRSRVVKILGELVSLDAVQGELQKFHHFPLGDFTVIAAPHPRQENELVMMVEGHKNFQAWKALLEKYNARTPGYQRIHRLEMVSQFPRTALGKIKTALLTSAFSS